MLLKPGTKEDEADTKNELKNAKDDNIILELCGKISGSEPISMEKVNKSVSYTHLLY